MLVRRLMTGLVGGLLTGGVVAADYPTFLRDYPDLLPEKTLVLISGDGERQELTVRELSLKDHRRRGMKGLEPEVVRNNPMLFVFSGASTTTWDTQDVAIPIVVGFIAEDGRVVATTRMGPDADGEGVDQPIRYVLQIAPGRAASIELDAGTRFEDLPRNE